MDDPPYPDTDDDSGVGPRESTTGPPRWVKVFAIIALVLVLLVVILLLAGGGSHGPGRHTRSVGGARGQTPPAAVIESGVVGRHQPPAKRRAQR